MILGLAGVVGVMLMGVVAEATISWASRGDDDDGVGDADDAPQERIAAAGSRGFPDDEQTDAASRGDLMNWADPSSPYGDDLDLLAASAAAVEDDGRNLLLSEVTEGDDLARIDDFDAATDHLVVVYDPELHPDPALTLAPTRDGSGMTVMLDGVPLAEVPGATDLRPDQVQLKPSMPMAA